MEGIKVKKDVYSAKWNKYFSNSLILQLQDRGAKRRENEDFLYFPQALILGFLDNLKNILEFLDTLRDILEFFDNLKIILGLWTP